MLNPEVPLPRRGAEGTGTSSSVGCPLSWGHSCSARPLSACCGLTSLKHPAGRAVLTAFCCALCWTYCLETRPGSASSAAPANGCAVRVHLPSCSSVSSAQSWSELVRCLGCCLGVDSSVAATDAWPWWQQWVMYLCLICFS